MQSSSTITDDISEFHNKLRCLQARLQTALSAAFPNYSELQLGLKSIVRFEAPPAVSMKTAFLEWHCALWQVPTVSKDYAASSIREE
jgi:hypothetical protein